MKEANVEIIKQFDKRLERIEKGLKGMAIEGPQWLKANLFMKKTGLSRFQLRYLRQQYCLPGQNLVKQKPRSTQYLYNLTQWYKINGQSNAA